MQSVGKKNVILRQNELMIDNICGLLVIWNEKTDIFAAFLVGGLVRLCTGACVVGNHRDDGGGLEHDRRRDGMGELY